MKNKKWKIWIIPIIVIAVVVGGVKLLGLAWKAHCYPYNQTITDIDKYDELLHYDNDRIYNYHLFPNKLPDNAKDMKWHAFSGVWQAKPAYTLSFITDEEFFKEDLKTRFGCYTIYLYDDAGVEARWACVERKYVGEVRTCSELQRDYEKELEQINNWMYTGIAIIPYEEYPYTCLYMVDDYSYVAYSELSGRIVYHSNRDICNVYDY